MCQILLANWQHIQRQYVSVANHGLPLLGGRGQQYEMSFKSHHINTELPHLLAGTPRVH